MKKRVVSLLLVLAIVLCLTPRAYAAGYFYDVQPGSWYEKSVDFVYENGLMNGTGGGKFEPMTSMSRAMLVTVLHRMAGEPQAAYSAPFTDLRSGAYYEKAVAWAYENGIVKGMTATTFCPDNQISREQMVTIFCRYAAYEGLNTVGNVDVNGYVDLWEVDQYAVQGFCWAVANGIVKGTDATHLSPNDNANRAACATIIQRYINWSQSGHPDDTRPYYSLGTCKKLSGTPYTLVIYIDDNESSWDNASVNEFWNDLLLPGLDFLEKEASQWGVGLDFLTGSYYTGMSAGVTVRYNGVIASNIMVESASYDVLDQAAASIGYGTKENMHKAIQEFSGQEEVMYIVAVNKDGRSYAIRDDHDDGRDDIEYCVVYPDYPDYAYVTPAASVSHELLHLYGGEDYYNPYGNFPGREKLAQQICPHDIMLKVYTDVSYNDVGNYTAYTVGWTNSMAAEYLDPNWWQ